MVMIMRASSQGKLDTYIRNMTTIQFPVGLLLSDVKSIRLLLGCPSGRRAFPFRLSYGGAQTVTAA